MFQDNKQQVMKEQVMIYGVAASANANAISLTSTDKQYFYWNDKTFKNLNVGDYVFVVNVAGKKVLFTTLDAIDISTNINNEGNTYFTDLNKEYIVSGKYEKFVRLKIISDLNTAPNWKWKSFGNAENTYLNGPKINKSLAENRILNINQLKELSPEENYNRVLNTCILNFGTFTLLPEIIDAINTDEIQTEIAKQEFYFQLAQDKFTEFNSFSVDDTSSFYDHLLSLAKVETKFDNLLARPELLVRHKELIVLIGELIAYCDLNAKHKKEYNKYSDHRVLAKSFVRQNEWVHQLLLYKKDNNSIDAITNSSIKNAVNYLINPASELTMLSENHRQMLAKFLLKKQYNKASFTADVLDFFKAYNIVLQNQQNYTFIISRVLYKFPRVKQLWFERVEGLVAIDTTTWMENVIKDLTESQKVVLWWSRPPTSKSKVDKLLQETIKQNGFYYFYYLQKNYAIYRARVVDYAYSDNYENKNWNKGNDVLSYESKFENYNDGPDKSASIVFLVDEFVKLSTPISIDDFEFYGDTQPPRQFNLQPYSELDWEEETQSTKKVWFVSQGESFKKDHGTEFIWAPEDDSIKPWKNVKEVAKGDIIFHYSRGIQGVSLAKGSSVSFINNYGNPAKPTQGNRVDVNFYPLEHIIEGYELKKHKDELKRLLNSIDNIAFTLDGEVAQKYLTQLTLDAGKYIRDVIYKKRFEQKEIDDFFDSGTINIINTQPEKIMETLNPKEIIKHVDAYMSSKGFQYKYEEIANFYLAIKTKPFVILAGISGTGKSQLPRKFAAAIGMKESQVKLLPVRPDWTDGSDLLGYTSLDGNFIPKDLTSAIKDAKENSSVPYFFILDEMNLARVEHYFSDFLSIIETRSWDENKRIKTDPILRKETIQNAHNASEFDNFQWPQNLYLIGTVNMDETTHAFSKKVLDRANSIEMNEVDLNWIPASAAIEALNGVSNAFFATEYIEANDLSAADKESIKDELNLLIEVNKILEKADLHFAYRVRDEIAFYLVLNRKNNLLDNNIAMDFQIVQKVLPRIHGSSERVQTILVELLNLLEVKDFRTSGFEYSQVASKINVLNLKYPRTSKKIIFMLKRFDDDRFTSFWL